MTTDTLRSNGLTYSQLIGQSEYKGLVEAMEAFTLEAFPTRIFVFEKKLPEKQGLIYIPETTKEMVITEGVVIAVGQQVTFCKPGDVVFYARYSGAKCVWNEYEYRVMNEEDLLGKEVITNA